MLEEKIIVEYEDVSKMHDAYERLRLVKYVQEQSQRAFIVCCLLGKERHVEDTGIQRLYTTVEI